MARVDIVQLPIPPQLRVKRRQKLIGLRGSVHPSIDHGQQRTVRLSVIERLKRDARVKRGIEIADQHRRRQPVSRGVRDNQAQLVLQTEGGPPGR